MKNKDFENRIKAEFEKEAPDLFDKILSKAENYDREKEAIAKVAVAEGANRRRNSVIISKMVIAASFVLIFTLGIFLGSLGDVFPGDNMETATVYLDVNPSIEIVVNENSTVRECKASNTDAERILAGMKLSGVEVHTALNAIIGSMYMNGYLTGETNSILVSAKGRGEKFESLLSDIVADVNQILTDANLSCSIIALDVRNDGKTEEKAEENRISLGKMSLLYKIIDKSDDYSEEDIPALSELSIKKLNLIYNNLPAFDTDDGQDKGEDREDDHDSHDEIISGVADGYISREDAIEAVLEYLDADKNDVGNIRIFVDIPRDDEMKDSVLYRVSVDIGSLRYLMEVNCKTADVRLIATESIQGAAPHNPSEPPNMQGRPEY